MPKNAPYVRFEVYVPVHFAIVQNGDRYGDRHMERDTLDPSLVARFTREAVKRFGGATQAHPGDGPPYRGWWFSTESKTLMVDDLTYFFVLVRADRLDEAERFFSRWQETFRVHTNQDVILITLHSTQSLGGFL